MPDITLKAKELKDEAKRLGLSEASLALIKRIEALEEECNEKWKCHDTRMDDLQQSVDNLAMAVCKLLHRLENEKTNLNLDETYKEITNYS